MIATSLSEIAALVGGALHGADAPVTAPAVIDSRLAEPGGLFVAFAGEHVDGHDYAEVARGAGAAGVLGSRPTDAPTVVVDDVQGALQTLARQRLARRRELGPLHVVAITGSQGKTSAKDLLGQVLRRSAPTVATQGSFNNELGLPLTVLRADEATRYLVLEMGARGIGHLADLCAIAPPDVSLVLNVGTAHIGEFGSRDAIAQAKGELVEALGPDGTAVLNADDHRVAAMAARTRGHVRTFGEGEGADVRLHDLVVDDLGRPSFALTASGRTEEVDLRLLGRHHAGNAAAAAAAALAVGVPLDRAAAALREVTAISRWRMELTERADGVRIVNDAYNANPESVRAALETLAGIGRRTGARTIAVLGEMAELGETSRAAHEATGALARELGVDHLVVVGEDSPAVWGLLEGARGWGSPHRARGVREAVDHLRETVRAPDVVLVKASHSVGLERVVDGLLAEEGTT
ncbi:UDP-N-acetylmuramoyl-tripeptide--D-alanyl-D-alanine ligase [Marmoricola endophyticus]|uniref:UDP-N-acetylmuramoyl-tripeptide--D-alanyl-D-alanine ligase n=1 Tax=Marmoricola endophyticus TaxID=2040280 RepID=A0A917BFV9_9ACTN|nr:UDP-N-acetylmuramoyl-tripeptide--D-alanyl-D-alanine ligase [Marmoricola endophyticus]GGF37968.1 UDP-N-acetylmuramoyl-tripeptide--D-alanyl-D-alanine ligase [Marmoricola endophyticus]